MLKQRNRHPVVWLGEELAGRINSARLQLDNRSLLAEWKPAYRRGYIMQASLAIVGGFFGLAAYLSNPRLALAARSHRPARELALHDLHDHADQ